MRRDALAGSASSRGPWRLRRSGQSRSKPGWHAGRNRGRDRSSRRASPPTCGSGAERARSSERLYAAGAGTHLRPWPHRRALDRTRVQRRPAGSMVLAVRAGDLCGAEGWYHYAGAGVPVRNPVGDVRVFEAGLVGSERPA